MRTIRKTAENLPIAPNEGADPPNTGRQLPAPAVVGRIDQLPIDRLRKFANNSRTHSKTQINQITASICEFGFVNPILIGPDDTVIAGHARLLAARQLDMNTVPVIILGHLSEAQRRALVIADNQLAQVAGWDEKMLRAELAALKQAQVDLDLLGFDDRELEQLLKAESLPAKLRDPNAVPAAPETPVTAAGDLWILGQHRLLCGDATRREVIDLVLVGDQANVVFADPPYNVSFENETRSELAIDHEPLGTGNQNVIERLCANLLVVCRGAIYICISSSEIHTLYQAFTTAGGHWSAFIAWAAHHFASSQSDYQQQYELILYGWREGSDHYWCGASDQGDLWTIPLPVANRMRPNMKPVELVERVVGNSSRCGDTVLDPFAGPGTTLIACERVGRRACLIELDPRNADVICERWEQYTGQPAIRSGDGGVYSALAGDLRRGTQK